MSIKENYFENCFSKTLWLYSFARRSQWSETSIARQQWDYTSRAEQQEKRIKCLNWIMKGGISTVTEKSVGNKYIFKAGSA